MLVMLKKSITFNLFLMLLVGLSGFFAVVWGLGFYTNHGETVVIPELRGKHLTEAIRMLDAADLNYEVVDSIYDKKAIPGSVIEAYPNTGESVKPQRIIFLKIYATSPPRISIPYLKDMSSRQALALLRGLGFEFISERIVAGEYMGLCQGIALANGKPLQAGDLVTKDTPLVLLVTGQIMIDSLRLDDLLAEDSLASAASAIAVGDSTQRKREQKQDDEPQPEPENFW